MKTTGNPKRDEWIKALRSGDFEQTTRGLRSAEDGSMCCLGVACAIDPDVTWRSDFKESAYGRFMIAAFPDGVKDSATLSRPFLEDLGLSLEEQTYLVDANDDFRLSFNEIADMIESDTIGKTIRRLRADRLAEIDAVFEARNAEILAVSA